MRLLFPIWVGFILSSPTSRSWKKGTRNPQVSGICTNYSTDKTKRKETERRKNEKEPSARCSADLVEAHAILRVAASVEINRFHHECAPCSTLQFTKAPTLSTGPRSWTKSTSDRHRQFWNLMSMFNTEIPTIVADRPSMVDHPHSQPQIYLLCL